MTQPVPAHQPTLYEALETLPEGVVGEILNGRLHTQPRPAIPHAHVAARFDRSIGRSYGDGIDGPGGWWIFPEPEVHLVRDLEVAVPDLAGWRRERMLILRWTPLSRPRLVKNKLKSGPI